MAENTPLLATDAARSPRPRRVFVLGATGSIGRATVRALVASGHEVVCFVRRRTRPDTLEPDDTARLLPGASLRFGEVTDAASLSRHGFRGERFDALALAAAKQADVGQMVLLSAICVQKPRLAFQHAKLAFERELVASGLCYSIVRATAYFKSLSGQVERVRRGKQYLVFGDGRLTACKPIGDDDLGRYLAECLDDETRWNRVLPIGGPGEAITPRQQGEYLFALLGRTPRFRRVPLALLGIARLAMAGLGRFDSKLADKAELAGIGHYYASESMLVLNPETGRYDADATPSTGTETLIDHYARLLSGKATDDRGDHAVF